MTYETIGKIKTISPVEKVGAKQHPKRIVVISVMNGNYEDLYGLEVFGQDKVKESDKMRVGEEIRARFTIRGREYQGRIYHNLQLVSAEGYDRAVQDEIPDDSGIDDATPIDETEDIPF